MPIHTIIAKTILTIGIKRSRIHHIGFLAMFNIKMMLAMGIQASHAFSVWVLVAIVCKASER